MKVPSLFAAMVAVFAAVPATAGPCRPPKTTTTSVVSTSATSSTSASPSSTSSSSATTIVTPTTVSTTVTSTSSAAPTTTLITSTSASPSTTSTTTTTSSTTSTTSSTPTPTVNQYTLVDTGRQQFYISVSSSNGAIALTTDSTQATPFYTDAQGKVRSMKFPGASFVDLSIPGSYANDVVYFTSPSSSNYAISCNNYPAAGAASGAYFGNCQATSPTGNPNVYGFGVCPGLSTSLFMVPNSSNVHCSGGYSFLGFFTRPYAG